LKKGEIKVTVIASGFPQSQLKKTLFGNSEGAPANNVPVNKETAPAPAKEAPQQKVEEDDDWGAVPAFLRRSKLK